jgi:DNA-binding winged helix-turn-helix (wHTH) protein/Tol biopolymer transport system component
VPVSPPQSVVHFGLFELDLKAGQLSRNGAKLPLPQQPLQLLALLLERPGEIVTRDELRQRLWASDVFVDFDHGLNKSIQKLRDALGDSATSPRYIQTIPRVGYRFIAPVRNGTRPLEVEPEIEFPRTPPDPEPVIPAARPQTGRKWLLAAAACAVIAIAGAAVHFFFHQHPAVLKYTQLTDFTDSASSPALSPDGHILAFIRSDSPFMSADPIYAKVLPNGEAIRLTDDPRVKYNLAFSPDGSQIAYTVLRPTFFGTYTVPVLGGEPRLLLDNAAGLTWLHPRQLLFSRMHSGLHLGLATQSVTGDNYRDLYFPAHERGMVHYSYASPDRKSALIVEMDGQGAFTSCGIVALEGSAQRRSVGPEGGCTSAGWSPDGSWMYFAAWVEGQSHLWRQRYPDGQPEQMTFGPTSEQGLAVDPDGRSVITSVGVYQSAMWIHDDQGERSLSSEGAVDNHYAPPSFAADGKTLYYLLWHQQAGLDPELWRVAVDSGKSEAVLPGISMFAYDVSPDGKQVVYATAVRNGKSQLWLAPTDRSSPPRRLSASGESLPHFGPQGKILFQASEGNANYLEQMNQDGSARSKVVPYPILYIQGVSPGKKWAMVNLPYPDGKRLSPTVMAIPLEGGPLRHMCVGLCTPTWSPNGKFLLLGVEAGSGTNPGRSLAIPVGPGETLPDFPPEGLPPGAQPDVVPGSVSVNREQLVPGEDPTHYAYVNTTSHSNLYRISLP